VIIATGPGCDGLAVGQRVACMGIKGAAPHATHGLTPRNLCFPIPDHVSFEDAAFNHLAATALQAIRRAELQIGEYVAVCGLGIIGQTLCQFARLCGCRVVGLDRLPMRLDLAKRLGAHHVANTAEGDPVDAVKRFTQGFGLDAAIMAFGGDGSAAFQMLLKMMMRSPDTHQMGRIVVVGGCKIEANYAASAGNVDLRSAARTGPGFLDPDWEHGRDYAPVFVRWTTRRNVQLCLDLIADGQLKVSPLITHRFPLSRVAEACDELIYHPERSLGVILLPRE
jgi:threonine dehydrogenase-like Zn-dependent dehydrogenase